MKPVPVPLFHWKCMENLTYSRVILRSSNESALRFFDLALFHGFFQVLSPRVHETLQQSDASIFSNFHHLEKGHGRTFNKK